MGFEIELLFPRDERILVRCTVSREVLDRYPAMEDLFEEYADKDLGVTFPGVMIHEQSFTNREDAHAYVRSLYDRIGVRIYYTNN